MTIHGPSQHYPHSQPHFFGLPVDPHEASRATEEVSESLPPFGCTWGPSLGILQDPDRRREIGGLLPRLDVHPAQPLGLLQQSQLLNGPFPAPFEADNQWRELYDDMRQRRDFSGIRDLRGMVRLYYSEDIDSDDADPETQWRGPPKLAPSWRLRSS
ncbi:hypothetical protein DFJ73DRAFT_828245 [Zopfochytrium polystomum]|nr:hypothetical protein DFJ73DRAFT_828245 [Zopfochytrium polystomum]